MASFKPSFTAVLLCVAFSCCRGQGQGGGGGSGGGGGGGAGAGGGGGIGAVVPGTQDSVQIVAQAALCFDNKPILNGCLQAMGVNASGGIISRTGMLSPAAPAIMCSPPCFGHVTMMMSCVNSIFGNFVSYNPGLMQGVQAIFQMSCGNPTGPGGAGGAAGGGGGAGGASGGVGGGAAGGGAGGMPNTMPGGVGAGGAAGGGAGGMPNTIPGGGGAAGGAAGGGSGGMPNTIPGGGGGAGGGVGGGAAGGGAGGIPNSIGGGAGGASGVGGTVSSVDGAAGGASGAGGGGNGTTIAGDDGTVTSSSSNSTNVVPLPPNAGSHVAVSNQSQPTSSADGPTISLKGACSSVLLVIWAGAWLILV